MVVLTSVEALRDLFTNIKISKKCYLGVVKPVRDNKYSYILIIKQFEDIRKYVESNISKLYSLIKAVKLVRRIHHENAQMAPKGHYVEISSGSGYVIPGQR